MKALVILFLVQAQDLVQVYQKELAFLSAQKRALKNNLEKVDAEFQKKIAQSERKTTRSQNRLLRLESENRKLSDQILSVSQSLENLDLNKTLLETTLAQAKVSLQIDETLQDRNPENQIKLVFDKAFQKLASGAEKSVQKGDFFLPNGKKTAGEILHYGHIARFALEGQKAKMLVPVGRNQFKLLENSKTSDLSLENDPPVLPAFLFESSNKSLEPKKTQTFLQMLEAGGTIAWVIVGLGVVALALIAVRAFLLWQAGRVDPQVISQIKSGRLPEFPGEATTPLNRVLQKTSQALDKTFQEREQTIHESILGELNPLDKFGSAILVMAAVAPLLGLLGTVTGMISTFDIITEFGTGDPKLLSGGISEALVTTKLGLMVAIPALLTGHLLSGWSQKIKLMLEREALRLSHLEGPRV